MKLARCVMEILEELEKSDSSVLFGFVLIIVGGVIVVKSLDRTRN